MNFFYSLRILLENNEPAWEQNFDSPKTAKKNGHILMNLIVFNFILSLWLVLKFYRIFFVGLHIDFLSQLSYYATMLISTILLVLGLVLVIKGADLLIDGASSLAKRMNVPEIVIGLTVVAFGTSTPELVVNVFASVAHKNEIVLGNIIGSNIFNILVILGVSGLIYPLDVKKNTVLKEIPFAVFTLILFSILVFDQVLWGSKSDTLSRLDSLVLLLFFVMFIIYTFGLPKIKSEEPDATQIKQMSSFKSWLYIGFGFVGFFIGGKLVVDNAITIARLLKVSDKFIGLTIVSMGTSIPELATSAVAAYKKRCDLAVGNIVGSNIFNLLLILGISSFIHPISFKKSFTFDLVVMGVSTVLLFVVMFTGKKHKLDRWEALLFLIGYFGYLAYLLYPK